MTTEARTSLTHPLEVGWLSTGWLGKVGLTFAPGKKQADAQSGRWDRDLDTDLARLRDFHKTDHLVCLLEDHELQELQIQELVAAAESRGTAVHRLPIRDGSTPPDQALAQHVAKIAGWVSAGETVVIHCKGGLGRAGTVGGCVLRAAGLNAKDTFAALVNARGKNCPETNAQRDYIAQFTPGPPTKTSRILGAALGAAIGDAMGHPTEFLPSMDQIRSKYGPSGVKGFELYWKRDGLRFAPYTDDTQMAEIVLRALIEGERNGSDLDATMKLMASGFAEWSVNPQGGHRAPGGACMRGAGRLARGVPWNEAGGLKDGGCGSVMRAYPFGIVFSGDLDRTEQWAVEHSKMTHRDPIALAACAAMAVGVALTITGAQPTTVWTAMIEAAARQDSVTATMMERALDEATNGVEPEVTLARLEGWAAHEAIAAGLYVAARHPDDPRAAILEGANTPGDSDSIATLAGALVGARTGLESIPVEWLRDVERWDELLALAKDAAALEF